MFLFFLGLILGVVLLVYLGMASAKAAEAKRQVMIADAKRFMASVSARHGLKVVETSLLLKQGESAFYSIYSELSETRAVRRYQSGSAGLRVAKGVRIGATRGTSYSTQELTRIDSGNLTVTNKRLIFSGNNTTTRTVMLSKVIKAEPALETIEIAIEGREKSMIFTSPNPLVAATVIMICSQVADPGDLSGDTVNIRFD